MMNSDLGNTATLWSCRLVWESNSRNDQTVLNITNTP